MKKFFATGFGQLLYLSRYRIILTYVLTVAVSCFMMSYPLLTGYAIDGVLQNNNWSMAPLAALWITHIALNFCRQVLDTRTFARINAVAATELISAHKKPVILQAQLRLVSVCRQN